MDPKKLVNVYFQKQEQEQMKAIREKAKSEKLSKEKEERKELHYMHCPKCGAEMETVNMENIEIDKCPECLGIYFDNEELQQLLEIKFEQRRTVIHKVFGLK